MKASIMKPNKNSWIPMSRGRQNRPIGTSSALSGALMAHRPSTTRLEQVARLENQRWFRQPRLNIKSIGKYRSDLESMSAPA